MTAVGRVQSEWTRSMTAGVHSLCTRPTMNFEKYKFRFLIGKTSSNQSMGNICPNTSGRDQGDFHILIIWSADRREYLQWKQKKLNGKKQSKKKKKEKKKKKKKLKRNNRKADSVLGFVYWSVVLYIYYKKEHTHTHTHTHGSLSRLRSYKTFFHAQLSWTWNIFC